MHDFAKLAEQTAIQVSACTHGAILALLKMTRGKTAYASSCMTSSAPIITFENVDKFYGDFHALKDISISVREGERMVICGPSGSGKSTLIRCINGLGVPQLRRADR